MKISRMTRKSLATLFTGSTLISLGFLSFAGMFILTPSLLLCSASFILAAVYENQVYGKSISTGLRRLFNSDHLAHGVVRQHLEKQCAIKENRNNAFLADYYKLKKHFIYLQRLLEFVEHQHHSLLFTKAMKKNRINLIKENLKNTKQNLVAMESFFLRQLKNINNQCASKTDMEKIVSDYLKSRSEKLIDEIHWKKKYIRACWITAIAGGISSGLAGYSAVDLGIKSLALLNIIPGGLVITLITFTAIGYTLLLYQTIAEMIQKYGDSVKKNFLRRPNESKTRYRIRCTGTIAAIGLALFATIATAGTWWHAAKVGGYITNVIRILTIPLMALGMMLFSVKNNIESVEDINQSNYAKLIENIKTRIEKTPKQLFFNIPWLIAVFIEYTFKAILFGGHLASIGAISDNVSGVSPIISMILIILNEGLTDMNYLPKKHQHNSFLLKMLFAPVLLVTKSLRFVAFLWDTACTWNPKESWKNLFDHQHGEAPKYRYTPKQSPEWRQQELIESCQAITDRLQKKTDPISKAKVQRAISIRDLACNKDLPKLNQIKTESLSIFSVNRSSLWKEKITQSREQIERPFANYAGH